MFLSTSNVFRSKLILTLGGSLGASSSRDGSRRKPGGDESVGGARRVGDDRRRASSDESSEGRGGRRQNGSGLGGRRGRGEENDGKNTSGNTNSGRRDGDRGRNERGRERNEGRGGCGREGGNRSGQSSHSNYSPGELIKDLDSLSQAVQRAKPGTGEIAQILKHSTFRPGAPAFTTLIKSCGRAGSWEKACELYDAMKARNISGNTITCSALINALGKSRQWEKAVDVFSEMQANGIDANIFTYSALISACAKGKRLDKALEMFELCQRNGVEPDSITYGAVISACEKGKRVDKALEIFDGMRKRNQSVECNVITYNSLLLACERVGKHSDTLRVFAAMRKEQVKPDRVTLNSVITAFTGLGDFKKALDVFREMHRDRVEADATSAAAALAACAGGGFAEEAAQIYREFSVGRKGVGQTERGDSNSRGVGGGVRSRGDGDGSSSTTSSGGSPSILLVTNALAAYEKQNAHQNAVDVIGAKGDGKLTGKMIVNAKVAEEVVIRAEEAVAAAKDAPPPVMTMAARIAAVAGGSTQPAKDPVSVAEVALAKAKRDAQVAKLLCQAGGIRCDLPNHSYVTLMHACERSGLFQRAVEVFAAARCASVINASAPPKRTSVNFSVDDDDEDLGEENPPSTSSPLTPFHSDPSSYERALRSAAAGGLASEAVVLLNAMRASCRDGETGAARASALAACAASAPGSAPSTALVVWTRIVTAVAAHAKKEGTPEKATPALPACRAALTCAAKDGDVELAKDVLSAIGASAEASTKNDPHVRVAAAMAFAGGAEGAESEVASTLSGLDDETVGSVIVAVAKSGGAVAAATFLETFLKSDEKKEKYISTVVAVAACSKSAEQRCDALLGVWSGEGVSGAEEGRKTIAEAAVVVTTSSPSALPQSSMGKQSDSTKPVESGPPPSFASFASAAGGGRVALGGSDSTASSAGNSISATAKTQGKGKGKKPDPPVPNAKAGQTANTSNPKPKGSNPKGWGNASGRGVDPSAAPKKPLVAASAPFTPAAAAKAAPFVPSGKKKDESLTSAAARLSIAAPAFTPKVPSAAAPAFVPKAKTEEK